MIRNFAVALMLFASISVFGENRKVRRARLSGIPETYIVIIPKSTPSSAVNSIATSIAGTYGATIKQVWENVRAFHCTASDSVVDRMAADARIEYIEQDVAVPAPTTNVSGTQSTWFNSTYMWHLDRIDEVNFAYANRDGLHHMTTEGRSIYAYLIDTGVLRTHDEFEPSLTNRVVATMDFSSDAGAGNLDVTNACTSVNMTGNWRHGTWTASVLGGTNVGVAKPQIVSLKVMRCSDGLITSAALISAVNWIRSTSDPYRNQPAVINHSGYIPPWEFKGTPPNSYSEVVSRRVTDTNVPFFTSADNFSVDACGFAPNDQAFTASRPNGTVFVVAGTALGAGADNPELDYRWQIFDPNGSGGYAQRIGPESGSNGGDCVSAYAPAVAIYRAEPSTTSTNTYTTAGDGTSFSSPMAAALAARYIERRRAQPGGVTPGYQEVYQWLRCRAVTAVQRTETPELWYCAPNSVGASGLWHRTNPGACSVNQTLYHFPATNNSNAQAKMLYWDETIHFTCP